MRPKRPLLPLLAALAPLAACNLDLPPQYRVPDVRILAIRAAAGNTAFADADLGQVVRLDALVANPRGRPGVTVDWYRCDPLGATLSPCVDPAWLERPAALPGAPGVHPIGSGSGDTGIATVSLDLAPLDAALRPAADALLAAANAAGGPVCRLYLELPVVAIVRAEGVTEVAVKRLRIAPTFDPAAYPLLQDAYVRNVNPAVETLDVNPTDLPACVGGTPLLDPLPAGTLTICAAAPSSVQAFAQCQPDGTATPVSEALAWQWYVTGGEIAGAGTWGNATKDPVTLTPPRGPFTLWVIVRDGRGGTGWLRRDLTGP